MNSKTMEKAISGLILGMLVCMGEARAEAVPELVQYLQSEISAMSQAVTSPAHELNEEAGVEEENESWYFQNLFLRLRPYFGVDVPIFAKFRVVPEVEMVFQRPIPQGWKSYRP